LISQSKMKNAWLISAILLWSTLPQAYISSARTTYKKTIWFESGS
jgi:hypothetical protein